MSSSLENFLSDQTKTLAKQFKSTFTKSIFFKSVIVLQSTRVKVYIVISRKPNENWFKSFTH